MNALKKMMAISLTLWLILITPALVGGSRIHSSSKEAGLVGGSGVYGSSKEAVVMARGPVPSSSSSPCTHIGIGNAQAMKEQAQLREEMAYQYKVGNFEAAAAIQRRLDPDVAM